MPVYDPLYDVKIDTRPDGDPGLYTKDQIIKEFHKCNNSRTGPAYFIYNYCNIYDNATRVWIPFHLWDAQVDALETLRKNRFVVVLKARQVGLTWLVLCFILWHALFRSEILGLLFSKREDEAVDLLNFRVKGIYRRLPSWMKAREKLSDSKKEWGISNGSRIKSSSSGGSDSYAGTHVLVDEADIIHESGGKTLSDLLIDVEPTIGSAGGWLILISRVDKSRADSAFKRIYRDAKEGKNEYAPIFIPWYARPDRDEEWYRKKLENSISMTGSDDAMKEQYPSTDNEALETSSMGKRFPRRWVQQCFIPKDPISLLDLSHHKDNIEYYEILKDVASYIPHSFLTIYSLPQAGEEYIICVDGAEGGQGGDSSAATVFNWDTGEEVAVISGKIETTPFAEYVIALAELYNRADLFPERNSIGQSLITYWQQHEERWIKVLEGPDSKNTKKKFGYYQDSKSKPLMWMKTADYLRDRMITIHSMDTMLEVADVDGQTLDAKTEGHDGDRAITVGLFCAAKELLSREFLIAFV